MTESGPQEDLDDVFRAIADPTRRRILDQLRSASLNTTALCEANSSMSRAGVINHIKILEAAELIRVEQQGRQRINHLNAARLQGVYDRWLTPFEQMWTTRLGDLARAAESHANTVDTEEQAMNTPVRVVEIIQQQSCAASPAQVWETLTRNVELWYVREFRDASSESLTLDLEPGGTLFDHRAGGSGYALATVRGYTPERELILDGEFGVPGALYGRLVVALEQVDATTTTITFTNRAIGAIPDELAGHEAGWRAMVSQLCTQAEAASAG